MALLDSEVRMIRNELGYNVMGLQAMPYIGISAIFDGVIQQYMTAGAKTTSSTPVTATEPGADPVPQSLVLADGTGFHAGDTVVVDVDSRQEEATVQHMPGASTISLLLSKAHTGTYPVTVVGGESIARECLRQLKLLKGQGGRVEKLGKSVGIKKVDEVEFFGGAGGMSDGKDALSQTLALIEYWRDQLAEALGVERLNRRGGGGSCEIF